MRKSRFTDEHIVAILRESDRTSVAEAAKRHKVSEQTIYLWRKHFAGLPPAKHPQGEALMRAECMRRSGGTDIDVFHVLECPLIHASAHEAVLLPENDMHQVFRLAMPSVLTARTRKSVPAVAEISTIESAFR